MSHSAIQTLSTVDLPSFSHSDPEGIAVIMPCIDVDMGQKTAEILHRRAGMDCAIFIVYDQNRQGFIKTLNQTAARLDTKYIVYLAQDAYPGRGWLKCGYNELEESGKGLLGFNDGKWQGRIASFGMVRTEWVKTLYNGSVFYPGYTSHAADNELTVIARCQDTYVYNPECTLLEYDPDKDFGGSNPTDNAMFKKRFVQGFARLVSLSAAKELAQEYKVKWKEPISIVVSVSERTALDQILKNVTRYNTYPSVELLILNSEFRREMLELITEYASEVVTRIVYQENSEFSGYSLIHGAHQARYPYVFFGKDETSFCSDVLVKAATKLSAEKIQGIITYSDKSGTKDINGFLLCKELLNNISLQTLKKQNMQKFNIFVMYLYQKLDQDRLKYIQI